MYIQELEDGSGIEEPVSAAADGGRIGVFDPKRAMVGLGARFLFYPTLLYNILRNKIQAEFRWWDEVDQFLLLGAVPFPGDVPHLKKLGVGGVVTLNEPYETLVPTSLYHAYGIKHLVLPTRDYLFAPSFGDICRAVDFIHDILRIKEICHVGTCMLTLLHEKHTMIRVYSLHSLWRLIAYLL